MNKEKKLCQFRQNISYIGQKGVSINYPILPIMLSFLPDQEPPPHSTPPCTLICQAKSTE
jgi:hypothetical protein